LFFDEYQFDFRFSLKVYSVVDEMFLAGEIRETSQIKVLKQLTILTTLE
jgi:AP-2 complex subunit sigma-1